MKTRHKVGDPAKEKDVEDKARSIQHTFAA